MNDNDYVYVQENKQSSLKPEGDYEVYIEKMEVRTLPTGTEKLWVQYRIREDVEQPCKNGCVFEDIWKEKANPNKFNGKRINRMLGTQKIKENTVFNGINGIIDFMLGKNLIIHVVQQFDDFNQETRNSIAYYKPSTQAPRSLGDNGGASKSQFVEITDDDLPF